MFSAGREMKKQDFFGKTSEDTEHADIFGDCYVQISKEITIKKEYQIKQLIEKISELEMQVLELKKENQVLHDKLEYLKNTLSDEAYQHAVTRQRVAKLETYLTTKNNGQRRDFDLLAVDLRNEVLRRGRKGLNYREVQLMFRFKSPQEAYRLMELTVKTFYNEVRLIKPKTKKQSRRIVPYE